MKTLVPAQKREKPISIVTIPIALQQQKKKFPNYGTMDLGAFYGFKANFHQALARTAHMSKIGN